MVENHNFEVYVTDGVKLKDPTLVPKDLPKNVPSPFDNKINKTNISQNIKIPKINYFDSWINAQDSGYNQDKTKEIGVVNMEFNPKEYIDTRISSLEKSIDQRFDSSDKLISEKIDNLTSRIEGAINNQNTKLDGSITNLTTAIGGKIDLFKSELNHDTDLKLNQFKTELVQAQKDARTNIITWVLGGGAIITALGIAIAQQILK